MVKRRGSWGPNAQCLTPPPSLVWPSSDFVKAVGIPCIIAAPAASMLYDLKVRGAEALYHCLEAVIANVCKSLQSTANVFCSLASATEKGDALLEGRKFIASAECEVTTKNKVGMARAMADQR